eukprot:GFKZ01015614.1.p1 GENE.GFKZ01015614.1~~GFKZ01015614.1.p1  ORF type:complete len:336 (+),score=7.31 GFKZ01015614.1:35-1009(+)
MAHLLALLASLSLLQLLLAHSWLTEPQPTAPRECSLGGAYKPGAPIRTCPGPCDVTSNSFLRSSSPQRPTATYRRGQTVTMKYNRNNHGPGGFVRLTLVPLDKMMDKEVHKRNAFHFSCWGATTVVATAADLQTDRAGFSIASGDGSLHDQPPSFHTTNATIPTVVADGDYILGWVWYGGIGGPLERNTPENPFPNGFFSDYWACAFVRIRGGPRTRSYTPQFVNELEHVWPRGCWSANNEPGVCLVEPCRSVRARFMVPKEFEGRRVRALTPAQFRSPRCRQGRVNGFCGATPTPKPLDEELREAYIDRYSCLFPSLVQQAFA